MARLEFDILEHCLPSDDQQSWAGDLICAPSSHINVHLNFEQWRRPDLHRSDCKSADSACRRELRQYLPVSVLDSIMRGCRYTHVL